ncbi:MAG TPA: hypothetical protein VFX49_12460 [Chloroflexota bacterium]|nr:hypothetical protein [Chloroflexota bacterium]
MTRALGLPRRLVLGGLLTAGCAPGSASSAAAPTESPPEATQVPAYVTQVQLVPQEPRLGTDENVVIRVQFRSREGRSIPGAQLQAVVNYPGGAQTFTSEQTTFPDGRVDLAVPVQPQGRQVPRGAQVRVEVVMRYQGQEYRSNSGFTVR